MFHWYRQAKFAYGYDFKLEPIIVLAVSKNDACYKCGQNWLKSYHLAILILIVETDDTTLRLKV